MKKYLSNLCKGGKLCKKVIIGMTVFSMAMTTGNLYAADMSRGADNFYVSNRVTVENIKFKNIFGMEIVGNLYKPIGMSNEKQYPAIIVGHPFGAVRQQAANLYATKMAEQGFVTLSFDQVFWGESEGSPRGAVIPDLYTESFSAAVDFLGAQNFVDRENIGVIGICASGGFAVAATKIDPRIKALATVSMYDMGEYFRTGLQNNRNSEIRNNDLQLAAEQRYTAFETGNVVYGPGQNDAVFLEAAESNDFYQTPRGQVETNDRRTIPATYVKFMNFYPFIDIDSISPRPILFVVGEKAPSRSYTEDAYNKAGEPKELVVIKDANRVDLYDRTEIIPWDKLTSFFKTNLK